MTLGQGHDTHFGNGQQLCELSRPNMTERSYGPYTEFWYVYNLTFEKWLGQGHDIMDNNCVD